MIFAIVKSTKLYANLTKIPIPISTGKLILKFVNENPNITTEIVYDFSITISTDISKRVDYQ